MKIRLEHPGSEIVRNAFLSLSPPIHMGFYIVPSKGTHLTTSISSLLLVQLRSHVAKFASNDLYS